MNPVKSFPHRKRLDLLPFFLALSGGLLLSAGCAVVHQPLFPEPLEALPAPPVEAVVPPETPGACTESSGLLAGDVAPCTGLLVPEVRVYELLQTEDLAAWWKEQAEIERYAREADRALAEEQVGLLEEEVGAMRWQVVVLRWGVPLALSLGVTVGVAARSTP